MPLKDKEQRKAYQKEYVKKHYLKNKDNYKKRASVNNERYIERNIKFVESLKNKHCKVCGKKFPSIAMDFHHTKDKKLNISKLCRMPYSLETIQKEIDKCELICSNCHRIKHAPLAQ